MSKLELKPGMLALAAVVLGGIILIIENIFKTTANGTFILTLSFWVAIIQGSVALAAAADAAKGKWLGPIKKDLLAFYPLILFMGILFLFLGFQMQVYPWYGKQHLWLSPNFFLGRNFAMLLISFLIAWKYASESLKGGKNTYIYAILYLFSFVITQSLVAFDWIMSLEYPWYSTLFGGLFFMESFFAGIAVAGIISGSLISKGIDDSTTMKKVMRDSATFLFGFALAWAGLFYAQYLVIWYGNLPEETSFLVVRLHVPAYHIMFYASIVMLFVIPFGVLVSKKAKGSTAIVRSMSWIVIAGVLLERVLQILPNVDISPVMAVIEFALMALLVWLFYTSRKTYIKTKAVS